MRILHLICSSGIYGAENVLINLLPSLRNLGIEVILGCLSAFDSVGSEISQILKQWEIPTVFINDKNKFSLRVLKAIHSTIKLYNPDILHVHGYKATVLGGLIANMIRIPFILTYHGEAKIRTELSTYIKIENIFVRKALRIIAVSKRIMEELIIRGVPESNISVIHNGIKDPFITHLENISIKKNGLFSTHLLTVGRLIKIKRIDLIIDAIGILKKEFPQIGLTITGNGPLENELKEYVTKAGLNSSVIFLGYVPDPTSTYNSADIFVISSASEGSPIALIEAMAASLPIIATSVGAIPEMLINRKNAIIIPKNDLKALVDSLRHLIVCPNLSKALGDAARQSFLRNYTADVMAKSYFETYKNIING